MKTHFLGIVLAGLLGVALTQGCSNSTSGGSTPSGTYCNYTLAGVQACIGWTNLSAQQTSSVTSECSSSFMGSIVSSCPSAGQVGCCQSTTSGYTQNICYYCGDASTYSAACTAVSGSTWTAGSGGSSTCGGSTGDAGGTTPTDSGATGGDAG
jgi:hypothetical protein